MIDRILEEMGYKVLRISEIDYNENPVKVKNKCIKFLLEGM